MSNVPIRIFVIATIFLVIGFALGRLSDSAQYGEDIVEQQARAMAKPRTDSARPTFRSRDSSSLLSAFSHQDLATALSKELSKSEATQDPAYLQLMLTEWVKRDPEGALSYLEDHQLDEWRYHCLTLYGQTDPEAALLWIQTNIRDRSLQNHFSVAAYCGLAKTSPQEAISKVEQLPQGAQRDQILYAVVSEWASHDVSSVFDWIEMQTPSPLLSGIYTQAMNRYIAQSPQGAVTIVAEMTDGIDKINFANQLAHHLGKQDPQKALDWIATLTGQSAQAARMGLMEEWGQSESALQALDYVKELPSDADSDELFTMVAMKMAQSYPESLSAELQTLAEHQQTIAVNQIAQVYSANNPDEIVAWIDTLNTGVVRDTAITASLSSLRQIKIDEAFTLSDSLSDDNLRRNEMQQTLLRWLPVDPEAAMRALDEASGLTAEAKEAMRENIAAQAPEVTDYLLPAK